MLSKIVFPKIYLYKILKIKSSLTKISFWGQFSSAIHQNGSLSEIDKFTYLKSFLFDPQN